MLLFSRPFSLRSVSRDSKPQLPLTMNPSSPSRTIVRIDRRPTQINRSPYHIRYVLEAFAPTALAWRSYQHLESRIQSRATIVSDLNPFIPKSDQFQMSGLALVLVDSYWGLGLRSGVLGVPCAAEGAKGRPPTHYSFVLMFSSGDHHQVHQAGSGTVRTGRQV